MVKGVFHIETISEEDHCLKTRQYFLPRWGIFAKLLFLANLAI